MKLALFGDGNGNAGALARLNDFLSRADEREKIQALRHVENKAALDALNTKTSQRSLMVNIAAVIVSLAALAATIFFGIAAVKLTRNQSIHLFSNRPVFSSSIKTMIPPL